MEQYEKRIRLVQNLANLLVEARDALPSTTDKRERTYRQLRHAAQVDSEIWKNLPGFIRNNESITGVYRDINTLFRPSDSPSKLIESTLADVAERLLPVEAGASPPTLDIENRVQTEAAELRLTPQALTVQATLGSPSVSSPPTRRQAVDASAWTGRRTPQQQATIVRELVPDAVEAITRLIDDGIAARLHNRPPEALEDEQVAALEALRDALTDLLDAVECGRPIESALGHLRACIVATFGFAKDTGQLMLASAPAVGAASVFGWSAYAIATMVAGIEPGVAATMAAGKMAVSGLKGRARARR